MKNTLWKPSDTEEIIRLYTQVFAASEGAEEGERIGKLVSDLVTKTPSDDLVGCVSKHDDRIVGCIFFSRFNVPSGEMAFMLSPVAIATDLQGTGIGQQLINYGLEHLRSQGVSLAFTYGNPAFYSKTGFDHIEESVVTAPYPLSLPHGWLAQSLDGAAVPAMRGPTQCVEAFSNPDYW